MTKPIHHKTSTLKGILFLFFLCSCHLSFSQDVILESQADLDAFDPATTVVNGNLYIRPPANVLSDITDLSNLSNLTTVHGELLIWRNFDLLNLTGLENLSYIQGDLEISSCTELIDINGIAGLDSVGGSILLAQLQSLVAIDNLDDLVSVGEDFEVYNCDVLGNITGINNLQQIGGKMNIRRNDLLQEIDGFASLNSISNELYIGYNDILTDIKNFNALSQVGSFIFSNNVSLDYVDAFDNLTTIGSAMTFTLNESLENIPTFSSLQEIGANLMITKNDKLIKINGLDALETIGGAFILSENPNFREINDLQSLRIIEASIFITLNDKLLQFGGMNALDSVGTYITIENNNELSYISGFNNLLDVGEYLEIKNNNDLEEIIGFQKIKTIGDVFEISTSLNLTDFTGFGDLTSTGSDFIFFNLPLLPNLDNLSSLESIGGLLRLTENARLVDIDGLINLQSIGGHLSIQKNERLKNIDGLINVSHIPGNIVILFNDDLENVDGFQNLILIGGWLTLSNNEKLTQIDGLANITWVPGNLTIGSHALLKNLYGLSNITTVGANLTISRNERITSLDGLENITSVGGYVSINFNDDLTDCCAIQPLLLDQNAVGDYVNISQNPSECSSANEITNLFCGMRMTVNTNPPCINADNGSIQVDITAYDSIPFDYHWTRKEDGAQGSGTSNQDFFLIENLSKGTYDLTVTNPRPDEVIRNNIIINELDGKIFEITGISSTNSSNESANGSIQFDLSGGTPPYDINWTGPGNGGNLPDLTDVPINIYSLVHGTYNFIISDSTLATIEVSITLLDETVPVFPCEEPLDIVILNDVSGSVDAVEYKESKAFFVNFLNEVNIGLEDDESRASIVEWSSNTDQKIIVPITGDYSDLNKYLTVNRSFGGGTSPHAAMNFGFDYLESVGRENVEKVLILSTDGSLGQISGSLIALADQFKAQGYHIVTIAFDYAFSNSDSRKTLQNVASINALAPGAPAYSDLDEDLAINIVNLYLCPIDPGSSATVYFNRDGAIEILDLEPEKDCPNPEFVEVEFKVEAFRELSIPSGTPVTFYLNDPRQYGATKIMTWKIPCTIPVGTSETYKVAIPIVGPSLIYAVLNDDGIDGAPITFPITELEEIAYSNNIDFDNICIGTEATIQVIKYATTPIPACDTIVNYTINVCNISNVDAVDVTVTDEYPDGFELIGTIVNTNNCATDNGTSFDIPVNCCVTLNLTYDASGAQLGFYNDQDVLLDGPPYQSYFNYDGASSQGEDVNIDGSIDCPSTIIEFTKEVNVTESCDDAFLVYTFTINNEMNIPIQGLTFSDIVPHPSAWAFQPYSIEGLSIGNLNIVDNEARFTINEVAANTVARFSMDMSIGKFPSDGQVINTATLENVPDPINGGFKTLTSNATTTQITASPTISIPDTIIFQLTSDTIDLHAVLNGQGDVSWTSAGDGIFLDENNETTAYILGSQDKIDQVISLFISVSTDCSETGEAVVVLLQECQLVVDEIIIGDCDDNGTDTDDTDDIYQVSFNVFAQYPSGDSLYYCIVENDTLGPFNYGILENITLDADDVSDILQFFDSQFENCSTLEEVNQQSCSDACNLILESILTSDCDDNGTPSDDTDDTYTITFNISASNPGMDSMYFVILEDDTLGIFPYDEEEVITLSADGIEDVITFVDSQFEDCLLTESINVESCSDECLLNLDSFTTSECDDNDTPSDYTDDTYTVTFNISAINAAAMDSYLVIIGNDTIGTYPYGSEQVISLSADGDEDVIVFIDSEFEDCMISESVNVQSCSNECILTLDDFVVSECDNNGTTLDFTDDTYTITFNVSAINAGSESSYFVIIGNDTIGTYTYGSEQVISLSADGVEDAITFVDTQNQNCILSESANVESCSNECLLNFNVILLSECNDNGTSSDNTDDTYSVTFILTAINPGSDSSYTAILGNDIIGIFPYNSTQEIELLADGIEDVIIFQDTQIEDCHLEVTFNEESCSDDCILTLSQFDVSDCHDEATSEEFDFDFYFVAFNVTTLNPSSTSYYLLLGNDTIAIFPYGEEGTITLNADGVEDVLHFVDLQNENCVLSQSVNIEGCSGPCEMSMVDLAVSACNDNGTGDDSSDDTFELSFDISAAYPSLDSTFVCIVGQDTLGIFHYNFNHQVTLPTSPFDYTITFVDSQFETCYLTEIVRVESCSNPCALSVEKFDISECNDNATSDIELDDTYIITFNVSATNPYQDSLYRILIDNESMGTFTYGNEYTLELPANGNETTINFMDSKLEYCFGFETIDLAFCSEPEPILDDIIIPNVFSPNDDGNNDNWTIELNNDSEIIVCDIYDRWGNFIYSAERGQAPSWDGTFNGKLVSQGVYVYKIIYLNGLGESVSKFGDITLIR